MGKYHLIETKVEDEVGREKEQDNAFGGEDADVLGFLGVVVRDVIRLLDEFREHYRRDKLYHFLRTCL